MVMRQMLVYVDDAAHAQAMLAPLLAASRPEQPTHWILVACAPRMTHRVSKWVSHRSREQWRDKWAQQLFSQLLQGVALRESDSVETVLARIPLADLLAHQQANVATPIEVLDARRPRADAAGSARMPGVLGCLLTGLGAVLALGTE